jgi:hypothetical protein
MTHITASAFRSQLRAKQLGGDVTADSGARKCRQRVRYQRQRIDWRVRNRGSFDHSLIRSLCRCDDDAVRQRAVAAVDWRLVCRTVVPANDQLLQRPYELFARYCCIGSFDVVFYLVLLKVVFANAGNQFFICPLFHKLLFVCKQSWTADLSTESRNLRRCRSVHDTNGRSARVQRSVCCWFLCSLLNMLSCVVPSV